MFENFVFGTQAQTANASCLEEDISSSPTDTSFPPTQACSNDCFTKLQPEGVNDIVQQLTQHSLQPDEHESPHYSIWRHNLPTPDFDQDTNYDFTEDELSYLSTVRGIATIPLPGLQSTPSPPNTSSTPHPSSGTVACRRLQRQLNVQLQSCNDHLKDITALVDDMVATSSQCKVHKSTPRPLLNAPASSRDEDDEDGSNRADSEAQSIDPYEDEGFVDMVDDLLALEDEMTLRRASAAWRVRKNTVIRWRKSADCVTAVNMLGAPKKRCVPRMRKRPKIVPE